MACHHYFRVSLICGPSGLQVLLRVLAMLACVAAEAPRGDMEAVERPHEVSYWDALYSETARAFGWDRAGAKTFGHAWQGVDLAALRSVLKLDLRPQDRVLVLGAGDSGLPEELFDAGCRNVTAVDFSPKLVAAMGERSHGALWRLEDARQLSFPKESFDVALELGLLDATAAGGEEQIAAALSEAYRVLRPGGIYVSVSTEPPLFRLPLFARHSIGEVGWNTKVLFLPRPRSLDPRVRRIDPALDMGKLSVYLSMKAGGMNARESLAVEPQATIAVIDTVVTATGEAVKELQMGAPVEHEGTSANAPATVPNQAGMQPDRNTSADHDLTSTDAVAAAPNKEGTQSQPVASVQHEVADATGGAADQIEVQPPAKTPSEQEVAAKQD